MQSVSFRRRIFYDHSWSSREERPMQLEDDESGVIAFPHVFQRRSMQDKWFFTHLAYWFNAKTKTSIFRQKPSSTNRCTQPYFRRSMDSTGENTIARRKASCAFLFYSSERNKSMSTDQRQFVIRKKFRWSDTVAIHQRSIDFGEVSTGKTFEESIVGRTHRLWFNDSSVKDQCRRHGIENRIEPREQWNFSPCGQTWNRYSKKKNKEDLRDVESDSFRSDPPRWVWPSYTSLWLNSCRKAWRNQQSNQR